MPKPRRPPYVPMDATIRRNQKLAALPSDTARLGWLYVGLGDAKLQRPSGCFAGKAHWEEVAGRFARYLRDYLAVGLLEQAPRLCDRCRVRWPNVPDGTLVVHDWKLHNTDPGAAGRAEEWRASQPDDADDEPGSNAETMPTKRRLNGDQTPIERDTNADLARDPAGPRGGNRNRNRRDEGEVPRSSSNGRAHAAGDEGPLLTAAELAAWSSFGPEWDGLKAAWLQRGLKLPPAGGADEEGSQRATLFPIVRDWPDQVGAWVRSAPRRASGREVVGHVIACYRDETGEARAADDDMPWSEGPPRHEAAEALGSILARVAS